MATPVTNGEVVPVGLALLNNQITNGNNILHDRLLEICRIVHTINNIEEKGQEQATLPYTHSGGALYDLELQKNKLFEMGDIAERIIKRLNDII